MRTRTCGGVGGARPQGPSLSRLFNKTVPRVNTGIDDGVHVFEYPRRKPMASHVMPYALRWIKFRAIRRYYDWCDIIWKLQAITSMPCGSIQEQHGMRVRRHMKADFFQVYIHRVGVAFRHDNGGTFVFRRADRPEDICRRKTQVLQRCRPRSAWRPNPRQGVLLADACLVTEPHLDSLTFCLIRRNCL